MTQDAPRSSGQPTWLCRVSSGPAAPTLGQPPWCLGMAVWGWLGQGGLCGTAAGLSGCFPGLLAGSSGPRAQRSVTRPRPQLSSVPHPWLCSKALAPWGEPPAKGPGWQGSRTPHGCSRRTRQVQSRPWLQVLVPRRWHPARKLGICVFLKAELCGGFTCSQRKSLELPPSPAWPALPVLPDTVDRDPLPAWAQSLLIAGAGLEWPLQWPCRRRPRRVQSRPQPLGDAWPRAIVQADDGAWTGSCNWPSCN